MTKKQLIIIVLIAFFVGALGSIVIDRLAIPYLAKFNKLSFLTRLSSAASIVINRREEVQLNEGVNLIDLSKQTANVTVGIYSKTNPAFLGNGIIITGDGLIFSSRSVVGNNPQVTVVLNDGRSFEGSVRAADPKSDLIVLTISASNLPVAQFDDASALRVGQRVLAVGRSNKSFNQEFATGFVTNSLANADSLGTVYYSESFTQDIATDAVLGSDFFGGPLVNLQGRVVALVFANNQFILSENLQTALSVYLATGKITRPYFGAKYLDLSAGLALLKGLPQAGALLTSIDKGSPAQKAGLQLNDLITSIDGESLDKTSLEQILNHHAIGDMQLKLLRNGKDMEIIVKLESK